MEHFYRL